MHTSRCEHNQAILLVSARSRQRALRPRLLCVGGEEGSKHLPARAQLLHGFDQHVQAAAVALAAVTVAAPAVCHAVMSAAIKR